MASLPPKPGSPPRDHDDADKRPYHPIATSSQSLSERISPIDRSYSRLSRPPPCDTYIAPYDNDRRRDVPARRHEPYSRPFSARTRDGDRDRFWDRDRDRERERSRDWERNRDRSRDWERERERDRNRDRLWERDRQYRPGDVRYSPSLARRVDDTHDRFRGYRRQSPPYRGPDPSYRRSLSRPRHSRSPIRRRPLSPRGRPRSRTPSPSRPSSPPPKRIRLGNHSIATSPRTPRSPSRSPPRKLHRLPPSDREIKFEESVSAVSMSAGEAESSKPTLLSHVPQPPVDILPALSISTENKDAMVSENVAPIVSPALSQPSIHTATSQSHSRNITPIPSIKTECESLTITPDIKMSPADFVKLEPLLPDIKMESPNANTSVQGSIPSPDTLKHSQTPSKELHAALPPVTASTIPIATTASDTSRLRRSPPRGPRGHLKASAPLSTVGPVYPTGPRVRRPYIPSGVQQGSPVIEVAQVPIKPLQDSNSSFVLPPLPVLPKRESIRHTLGQDIARVEAHRLHLANEYAQISKNARRALHELDVAMIDMRAAEGRRRIADVQLEKAKTGTLGVDATPSDFLRGMQVM